jgi:hypothetical protein
MRSPTGEIRPRRWGWVVDRNRLTCPAGHRVHTHRNLGETGFLQCGTCNALLYVCQVPAYGGTRRLWAADVTVAERDGIADQGLTHDQVLELLGADFPARAGSK